MAYKYKRVIISENIETEHELDLTTPINYEINRLRFLELINSWNRLALIQADVNKSGKVEYLYIAL